MVERLEKEMNEAGADVKHLDMIMFPIHKHAHYYIYCFYPKNNIVDVIDNRMLPDGVPFENKYAETFNNMVAGFKVFCEKLKLSDSLPPTWVPRILIMPWRSNDNNTDCGVFAIRHLETYRGQGHRWDSGFAPASTKQGMKSQKETLQKLRLMYAAQLLLSKFNTQRDIVLKKAKEYITL
ncbi:unnamed protein product [Cuscuta epithymum]|nr:unnamed protein product [Cuscuta epithymum]